MGIAPEGRNNRDSSQSSAFSGDRRDRRVRSGPDSRPGVRCKAPDGVRSTGRAERSVRERERRHSAQRLEHERIPARRLRLCRQRRHGVGAAREQYARGLAVRRLVLPTDAADASQSTADATADDAISDHEPTDVPDDGRSRACEVGTFTPVKPGPRCEPGFFASILNSRSKYAIIGA